VVFEYRTRERFDFSERDGFPSEGLPGNRRRFDTGKEAEVSHAALLAFLFASLRFARSLLHVRQYLTPLLFVITQSLWPCMQTFSKFDVSIFFCSLFAAYISICLSRPILQLRQSFVSQLSGLPGG